VLNIRTIGSHEPGSLV